MPVNLNTQYCKSCERQTGHLQNRMNHSLYLGIAILMVVSIASLSRSPHLLITIATILWILGWIASAMQGPYQPRHCMACGTPEPTPIPPEDTPIPRQDED